MEIPRQLIYQERWNITDFDINKDGSLNKKLYDEWLLKRPDLHPEKPGVFSRKLSAFNDAYFMCTLLLLYKDDCENALPYLVGKTSLPSIVIPMVYFYLSGLKDKTDSINRFLTSIETAAENDENWKRNLEDIQNLKSVKGKTNESIFKLREINQESLSKINYQIWAKATNNFSRTCIKNIIKRVAKKYERQLIIAEAINSAAIKDENIKNAEMNDDGQDYYDDQDNWEEVDLGEIPDPICLTNDIVEEIKNNHGLKDASLKENEEVLTEEEKILKANAAEHLYTKLLGLWISENISPLDSLTEEWLQRMIENLMNTKWGIYIAKEWRKVNTHDSILFSLVGVLNDLEIFKKTNTQETTKYSDLAREFADDTQKTSRYSDYMSHKKKAKIGNFSLALWLKEYKETSLSGEFPTE